MIGKGKGISLIDRKRNAHIYVLMYGNAPASRCSKKEIGITLSSCEEDYIADSIVACQEQWLSILIEEINLKEAEKMALYC